MSDYTVRCGWCFTRWTQRDADERDIQTMHQWLERHVTDHINAEHARRVSRRKGRESRT